MKSNKERISPIYVENNKFQKFNFMNHKLKWLFSVSKEYIIHLINFKLSCKLYVTLFTYSNYFTKL